MKGFWVFFSVNLEESRFIYQFCLWSSGAGTVLLHCTEEKILFTVVQAQPINSMFSFN